MASWRQLLWEQSPREHYLSWLRHFRSVELSKSNVVQRPLFVLSTGRVGTQTVAALANLADSIMAYHEPEPKLYALGKLAYEKPATSNYVNVFSTAFTSMRARKLEMAAVLSHSYVESSPQVTFLAQAIVSALPNAQFLHLVRGPNEVVRSAMRRNWYAGNRADSQRIEPLSHSPFAKQWSGWSALQKNYWLWAETNHWIFKVVGGLESASCLRLRSELLFAGDDACLGQFYEFLDREVPAGFRLKRVLGKNLNAQRGGDFQPPQDLEAALSPELFAFVLKVATEMGIDEKDWLDG